AAPVSHPARQGWRPLTVGLCVLSAGLAWTGVAAASTNEDGMGHGTMAMSGARYWAAVGGGGFHSSGVTRTYYIGADVVAWNYAPTGRNQITGRPFDEVADTYVKRGSGRIGSTYDKCLYRGYTDAGFAHLQSRPADEAYLGL